MNYGPPELGCYYTDGMRLVEVVAVGAAAVQVVDAMTEEMERIKRKLFASQFRRVLRDEAAVLEGRKRLLRVSKMVAHGSE